MNTDTICRLIPRVAEPLCRVLLDPFAAYTLVYLNPSKIAMLPLFISNHREDMRVISEALSVDLADKPLPEAIAMIPANEIHELACLIADIYGGIR